MKKRNMNLAIRVSVVSVIVNIVLSLIKFAAGIVANSTSMISDAIHSASDVLSTIIVMIGIVISNKKADYDHQYGHERMESVAALVLSVILCMTGLKIGIDVIETILKHETIKIPGTLALGAAILSIVVKEWMYWYTIIAAKKIGSDALKADAWHHRSDALSSIGAFIGILGARLGYPILEPIASIIICLFIVKAAYEIFIEGTNKLVDKAAPEETINNIKNIINKTEGVLEIDMVKTRMFGSKIYVDVEFKCDENLTLKEAHQIAENVHDRIEKEIPDVKHCMVHINPLEIK